MLIRPSQKRPRKRTVLIFGEGQETEPNYFRGLRDEPEVQDRFTVTVKKGSGRSPESVVQETINHMASQKRRGESYDEVWCVLDVEGQDKRASLDRAIVLAQEKGITLCLSNPSFEVWLVAHFERSSRHFNDSRAVEDYLSRRHWQNHFKQPYNKTDENIYKRLKPKVPDAIVNAQSVLEKDHQVAEQNQQKRGCKDCNSSTEVYLLVQKLSVPS